MKFPNLVPDLESPNQLFETQSGENMKYQPFHHINGSVQFGKVQVRYRPNTARSKVNSAVAPPLPCAAHAMKPVTVEG